MGMYSGLGCAMVLCFAVLRVLYVVLLFQTRRGRCSVEKKKTGERNVAPWCCEVKNKQKNSQQLNSMLKL